MLDGWDGPLLARRLSKGSCHLYNNNEQVSVAPQRRSPTGGREVAGGVRAPLTALAVKDVLSDGDDDRGWPEGAARWCHANKSCPFVVFRAHFRAAALVNDIAESLRVVRAAMHITVQTSD